MPTLWRVVPPVVLAVALAVGLAGCAHRHPHAAAIATPGALAPGLPKERVLAAWERLKTLQGAWNGRSTKGWTDRVEYKLIAGETCLVEISFDAHPNETMLTIWHMDGDRLMLTHYCVAKNQPRLVLTGLSDDARELTFEFLDATNLPSRDTGHMDKLVMTIDADTYAAQWTWYQKGRETWMERIEHARTPR